MPGGPLIDYTDDELNASIREDLHVTFFYADKLTELDRRARNRQTFWLIVASMGSFSAAVVAVAISVVALLAR
jgi:hypothetical protein